MRRRVPVPAESVRAAALSHRRGQEILPSPNPLRDHSRQRRRLRVHDRLLTMLASRYHHYPAAPSASFHLASTRWHLWFLCLWGTIYFLLTNPVSPSNAAVSYSGTARGATNLSRTFPCSHPQDLSHPSLNTLYCCRHTHFSFVSTSPLPFSMLD